MRGISVPSQMAFDGIHSSPHACSALPVGGSPRGLAEAEVRHRISSF